MSKLLNLNYAMPAMARHARTPWHAMARHAPPGFSHTLFQTSQISKILFLVVNTGSIFIGPPTKKFSADAVGH